MEVLTAFIREHSREPWPPPDPGNPDPPRSSRPDVLAAISVVGRWDAKRDILPIDLARAQATGADLTGADLTGADFTDARLIDADLTAPRLTDANFIDANFTRARLAGADLTIADPTGANLTGATWPEEAPVPEGWAVGSDSRRLKRTGGVSEVTAHYL